MLAALASLLLFAFGLVLSVRAILRRNNESLARWAMIALISLTGVMTYQPQIFAMAVFLKIVEPFNF